MLGGIKICFFEGSLLGGTFPGDGGGGGGGVCWFLVPKRFQSRKESHFLFCGSFDANSVPHLERVLTLHDNKEKLKFLKLTEFGVFI